VGKIAPPPDKQNLSPRQAKITRRWVFNTPSTSKNHPPLGVQHPLDKQKSPSVGCSTYPRQAKIILRWVFNTPRWVFIIPRQAKIILRWVFNTPPTSKKHPEMGVHPPPTSKNRPTMGVQHPPARKMDPPLGKICLVEGKSIVKNGEKSHFAA